tara:strand:+ start:570 stop:1118 length:549 start_codon:yes stop_codon:yes gene_type:complete
MKDYGLKKQNDDLNYKKEFANFCARILLDRVASTNLAAMIESDTFKENIKIMDKLIEEDVADRKDIIEGFFINLMNNVVDMVSEVLNNIEEIIRATDEFQEFMKIKNISMDDFDYGIIQIESVPGIISDAHITVERTLRLKGYDIDIALPDFSNMADFSNPDIQVRFNDVNEFDDSFSSKNI